MKKNGYTLAEALIAMGVIGIVAALMLPLMNKYKPDNDKAIFLRTYDSIVEAIAVLVSNDEFYPHEMILNEPVNCEEENNCNYMDYSRAPLLNSKKITLLDEVTELGDNSDPATKLCATLAYQMHTVNNTCTATKKSITLVNNTAINISYNYTQKNFKIDIVLPTYKEEKANSFLLYANGHIIPNYDDKNADETISHIMTRGNWKKTEILNKEILNKEKEEYKNNGEYWQDKTEITKRESSGKIIPE